MNRLFICTDADSAGGQVGTAILMDDAQMLADVSSRINAGQELIHQWVEARGGHVISIGGDESASVVDPRFEGELEALRQAYHKASGFTLTIGCGLSLSQAGKSLMVGKSEGKDRLVRYDHTTEEALKQIHDSPEGAEDEKINEHYLDHIMGGQDDDFKGEGHEAAANMDQQDDMEDPAHAIQAPEAHEDEAADGEEDDLIHFPMDEENFGEDPEAQSDKEESAPEQEESEEAPAPEAAPSEEQPAEEATLEEGHPQEEAIDLPVNPKADLGEDKSVDETIAAAAGEAPAEAEAPQEAAPAAEATAAPEAAVPQASDLDSMSQQLDMSGSPEEIKAKIAENLQRFKANKDLIEQMAQSNPELYQSIMGLMTNLIEMAQKVTQGEAPQEDPSLPKQNG